LATLTTEQEEVLIAANAFLRLGLRKAYPSGSPMLAGCRTQWNQMKKRII